MRYRGSKLKKFVQENRGKYTEICEAMLGGKKKGLDNYYHDDRNIRINKLSQILKATGMPLEYFVEFEPGEMIGNGGNIGNNNVINSMIGNDLSMKVDHLNEIIRLKDQVIAEKERNIVMKDQEIELWKKRYDDMVDFSHSNTDKSRT